MPRLEWPHNDYKTRPTRPENRPGRHRGPARLTFTAAFHQPRVVLARVQRAGAGAEPRPTRAVARTAQVPVHLIEQPRRILRDPRRRPEAAARARLHAG